MRRFTILHALVWALALAFVAGPAAAEGPFTVSGIKVEASAASSVGARNAAIAAGRERAWQVVFRRVTRQQDWTRQPALNPDQLQRLISSYFPQNEKRSTTRYVAEVTYIFNPDAVAKLLQSSNIAYTVAAAKRVLLIPLGPGYARASGWTSALANPRFFGGLVPFALPLGDAADMQALASLGFDGASWSDIAAVAARQHATEAVLAQAVHVGAKMVVNLRRIGPNPMSARTSVSVPMLQDAAGTYASAADAAVGALEDLWKSDVAVDYSQKAVMEIDIRTDSLQQWAAVQSALGSMPNVAQVAIQAMDIGMARVTLRYVGTLEQLRETFLRGNLMLAPGEGGRWRLSPTAGFAAHQP